MNLKRIIAVKPGIVALMLLMASTRFHHFGTAFSLPDASLAVFFLAGFYLGGRFLFAALLLEAGLIDYLAITQAGVSDFCISPAYVFLIPTYAAMWLGGKYCRKFPILSISSAVKPLAVLLTATSGAFLISNGSFYLLSDRTNGSWSQYLEGLVLYYPPYLTSAVVYSLIIIALLSAMKSLKLSKNSHEAF